MKKFYLFAILLLGLFIVSCDQKNNPQEDEKEVYKELSTDVSEVSLTVGETKELKVIKSNLDDDVIFSSSDEKIATIDENGLITAISKGTADIIVTCEDLTCSVSVTVSNKKYQVTFIGFDGSAFSTVEAEEGSKVSVPLAPTVDGYKFMGWDKSTSLLNKVTSDLTFTASYKKLIKVSYVLNGGEFAKESDNRESFVDGGTLVLPTPVKANCDFYGWSTDADGKNSVTRLTSELGDEITVYAHFEPKQTATVTFVYNGGYTENALISNPGDNPVLAINSYNYANGTFWGGRYTSDIFIGDKEHDALATFSDRIYIKMNADSGLYEVVEVIRSGASHWPDGAEYVIYMSTSCSGYYANIRPNTLKINEGDMVVFNGDFKEAKSTKTIKAVFFPGVPEASDYTMTIKHSASLPTPTKIGYTFKNWTKEDGTVVMDALNLLDGDKLYASWEELNPVTGIKVNDIPTEMIKGNAFKIIASVEPADAYFKQISYVSSDEKVITVDKDGNLQAVNAGSATITLYDYLKKAPLTKEITVYPKNSISISFSEGYNGVLDVGDTVKVNTSLFGKNAASATVTYASSNNSIATVDSVGNIKALAYGKFDITIKSAELETELTFSMIVKEYSDSTKVDKLLKLLAENNFAAVEVGNVSLYNDGTNREYRSTYGSVNRYLFDEYKVDTTYYSVTENNPNNHKSRSGLGDIEFVTVHDTATLTGTVKDIASGMSSGETSIHYTVGNGAIYGVVPEKYIAYHAGDGTHTAFYWTKTDAVATENVAPKVEIVSVGSNYYLAVNGITTNISVPVSSSGKPYPLTILGPVWKVENGYYYIGGPYWESEYGYTGSRGGNNNSIGIEMCVNTTSDIYDTWQRTSQLVADILIRNNLDTTRVKMHNTWSGKPCPQCIISGNYWYNFMEMVEVQYEIQKNYSDATIVMKSNNPDIVDNTGRVKNPPEFTTTVSYDVTVTIGSTTKTITLYSVIRGTTTWEQWNGTFASSNVWNNGNYAL